ncbi:MAG TPA: TRAP transporter substrate-binding protein, partial [Bacillota bacterium]|nr:TRAP transporter substrate-binding protein [Bacillota bacterium]
PTNASSKIILRSADVHALGYPTVESVKYMSRLVRERTGGRIEIVVYPNGSLGSEKSVVDMLQIGALDLGRVSVSQVAEVDPQLGIFVLPYLFKNDLHKWQVLEGSIGNDLLAGLARWHLIGLCFQESGYRSFYNSKRPIYHPADLKGLKIRTQPSHVMSKLVESLGAVPIPINYNEVYPALVAEVIDGAENNLPSYLTAQHYKKARFYSLDRHSSIPEILLISQKTWLKLSGGDQQIMMTAARESSRYQRRLWEDFEKKSREQLQKQGTVFNEVDIEAFHQALKPFSRKYGQEYQRLLREIEALD